MCKKSLYLIISVLTLSLLLSCENIGEEHRFVKTPVNPQRNVLIEDFTGQKCINCPNATAEIVNYSEFLENHLVAVSIHGGSMALKPGAANSLSTNEGNQYNKDLKISSWPCGRINRSEVLATKDWANKLIEEVEKYSSVSIYATKTITNDSLLVNLSITGLANDMNGSERLTVWITEDSVRGLQTMPDGKVNSEYIHRHVYRASMTDFSGDAISTMSPTYRCAIKNEWKQEHLHVVAFVTRNDYVLNVIEK